LSSVIKTQFSKKLQLKRKAQNRFRFNWAFWPDYSGKSCVRLWRNWHAGVL